MADQTIPGHFVGIIERKHREREQRRQAVLAVARELVLSRGVRDFSLQDVADRLEVSKAALYLLFRNKDEILATVLRESATVFQDYLSEQMNGARSGLDALKAMARSYFLFYHLHQDHFILFGIKDYFAPAAPLMFPPNAMTDLIESFVGSVRSAIERGIRDGTLAADLDPEAATRTTMFIAISLIDKVSRLPAENRDSSVAYLPMQEAFALLLRALAHPAVDRRELKLELPPDLGAGSTITPGKEPA